MRVASASCGSTGCRGTRRVSACERGRDVAVPASTARRRVRSCSPAIVDSSRRRMHEEGWLFAGALRARAQHSVREAATTPPSSKTHSGSRRVAKRPGARPTPCSLRGALWHICCARTRPRSWARIEALPASRPPNVMMVATRIDAHARTRQQKISERLLVKGRTRRLRRITAMLLAMPTPPPCIARPLPRASKGKGPRTWAFGIARWRELGPGPAPERAEGQVPPGPLERAHRKGERASSKAP